MASATPPAPLPDRPAELAAEEEFPISLVADDELGEEVKWHALEVLRGWQDMPRSQCSMPG